MKSIFFSLFLLLSCTNLFAQDTIVKRNSEIIIAKILEINPTDVKFKKFNFLDGPTYTESKSGIKMIVYVSGEKDEFEELIITPPPAAHPNNNDYVDSKDRSSQISLWNYKRYEQYGKSLGEPEIHDIMRKTGDHKLNLLVEEAQTAKRRQSTVYLTIPLGVAAFGILFGGMIDGRGYSIDYEYVVGSAICFSGAIACPIASTKFRQRRIACDKAMVKLYNEKY